MLRDVHPLFLANRPHETGATIDVTDKFHGTIAARCARADAATIDAAIAAAAAAVPAMRRLAACDRQAILRRCADAFAARAADFARVLCIEAGKPIRDARVEVTRLVETFRLAADEVSRFGGEVLPLDASARGRAYFGATRRVPVGACSFISPFNFPLNLVAHKIAPALAVGCPFVLKPASLTPLGALLIGEVLAACDLPDGAFSILPCGRDAADAFTTDPRLALLSFTGSPDVGWDLKGRAGRKKVVLELGGNAAAIVDETADLDDAAARLVVGAFYQSGQSCIGVQRILVHERVLGELRDRLVAATRALRAGDPHLEETFVGPMITEAEARRIEEWIAAAVARGARVLCGGERRGAVVDATLLEGVPRDLPVWCREAFGPVACLAPFATFDEALADANDSIYGLQAGVFTRDIQRAHRAWEELEVGGVIINDIPSWRVDHMPYGGIKASGFGREGVRWAMEEMTEPRLFVLRRSEGAGR